MKKAAIEYEAILIDDAEVRFIALHQKIKYAVEYNASSIRRQFELRHEWIGALYKILFPSLKSVHNQKERAISREKCDAGLQ